jgi:23S rRNA (adenine2503-C2)-methyltransferase
MEKTILCGLDLNEIHTFIKRFDGNDRHSLKLANSIYKKGTLSFAGIKDLPKKLLSGLIENSFTGVFNPSLSEQSSDGTIKYLFISPSGTKFETVYIPDKKRHTVCVSSQAGCRMGCKFCATARYGFHGNLTAGEIINQVIGIPPARKITHVVFMGMGEPMDNFENVVKATNILTAEWGKALSARNITVSTVGMTPFVKRFLDETDCNLTVSLFTPFFGERSKFLPVENKFPVEEIIPVMKNTGMRKKRRLTFSYMMIRDLNDSERHLSGLKDLVSGSGIRVNLIPYHRIPGDEHTASSPERMQLFKHNLVISGISASIRRSRGADISAACGLLASAL